MSLRVACFSLILAACGSSKGFEDAAEPSPSPKDAGSTAAAGEGRDAGASGTDGDFGTDAGPPSPVDDCSEEAKLVYVVSYEDRGLYSFKPNALQFTRIGTLECTGDANVRPRSMAVDRRGTAWINHTNGRIYKVSTKDAHCVDSGYEAPSDDWSRVNMGFAADVAGGTNETLYVVSSPNYSTTRGLGKIDTTTLKLTPVGTFSGPLNGISGELTGTGSARLFGFFKTSPKMTLSELDPKSGASVGDLVKIDGTEAIGGYAFSFWGGDFWFYVGSGSKPGSKVVRYKASGDKSQSVVLDDVGGFLIVGAGVSTCAPTVPVVN